MTTVAKAFLDIRGTGQRREEEAGETCVAQEEEEEEEEEESLFRADAVN